MYFRQNQSMLLIALVILIAGFVRVAEINFAVADMRAVVTNFEQCVAVGNPIMKGHPRLCRSAGIRFMEETIHTQESIAFTP